MSNYITIEAVESMQVSPEGFLMVLTLSAPPDELLSAVISRWKYRTPGLKGLRVQDDALVVHTELDPEAPATALRWLYGGNDPALAQMQGKVREMDEAARDALAKARDVFNRPV